MRAGIVVVCVLSMGVAGCSRWYGRGALLTGGSAALGAGIGALLPCSESEPGCRTGNMAKFALISGLIMVAGWGASEVAIALGKKPSDTSSSYESGPSSTPADGHYGTGQAVPDGSGCPCGTPYAACIQADVGDGSGRLACERELENCLTTHCGGNFEHEDVSGDGTTTGTTKAE
jgi:hypothetical protein